MTSNTAPTTNNGLHKQEERKMKVVKIAEDKVFVYYQLTPVPESNNTQNKLNSSNNKNNHYNNSNSNNNNNNNNNTYTNNNNININATTNTNTTSNTTNNNSTNSTDNSTPLHVSQDIRRSQLHQVYRMYDNDRVDALCSKDSHVYNIPLRTRVGETSALLYDEFPSLLRGYISASFYTEVISKLNNFLRDIYAGLNQLELTLLLFAGIIFFPLLPLAVLRMREYTERDTKRRTDIQRYLASINSISRNIKFEFVTMPFQNPIVVYSPFSFSVEILPNKFYRTTKLGVKHF